MTITFALSNQIISRTDSMILASGSKNYVTAQFDLLTEDWTAPITAIFNEYTVVLDENNQCLVPWEVLANPGKVAVSAFCGDLHTATSVLVPVHPGGYIDGQTPQPPTPGVYEQLTGMVQTAVDTANDVKERADAGEFNGKDAPQIDDTQASPDHPWSGAKVDQEVKQLSEQIGKVNKEVADAREGYFGEQYDSLCERIDGDINNVLDKVNVMAYEGTSFHATNTYARNLNVNRNKVEILGQTIQNCLDHSSTGDFTVLPGSIDSYGYITIQADGSYKNFAIKSQSAVLKPNTQYTLVIDVAENSFVGDGAALQLFATGGHISYFENGVNVAPVNGTTKFLATTKTDFEGVKNSFAGLIYSQITSGSIKFRLALIEGDWTDKDVSWVPFGLNAPQTTEVKMVGRNLAKSFDPNVPTGAWAAAIKVDANFEPGTKYLLYAEGTGDGAFYPNEYLFKEYIDFGVNTPIVVTTLDAFSRDNPETFDSAKGQYILAKNRYANTGATITKVLVERYDGDMDAAYVDYVENTITINKPLGSVSDTIRDRVYLKDGKAYYEQNVGEIVFDGSEEWSTPSVAPGSKVYTLPAFTAVSNIKRFSNGYSSLFAENLKENFYSVDTKGFNFEPDGSTSGCRIRVPVTELETINISGIKKWLAEHPMVVVYQLDVPVTTEIPIADFLSYAGQTNWYTTNDIKPTLKAEIPSNIGAVVSSTIAENAALRQENAALSQQVAALSEELQVSKILLGVD